MARRAPVGSGGIPPGNSVRPSSKDVEILATLLVAYPQVSRVTYDPKRKALNLAFLCKGPMSVKKRKDFLKSYLDSVSVYLELTGTRALIIECMWEKMDDFYCLLIERDIASLTPGELNLTVELLGNKARVLYASDEGDFFPPGDDMNASTRVFLQDTVNQVKNLESTRKLVALREGEKVLVFDK
ncbi:MAG: hypothetical protein GX863_08560 [Firmicutes bacterium]|nr:hypothetical protein [Candidatus Fermentithermobacillaceae bacterium]